MDIFISALIVGVLLIFEPGNKELNEYCSKAVEDSTFQTRKECWDYYKDERDFPGALYAHK